MAARPWHHPTRRRPVRRAGQPRAAWLSPPFFPGHRQFPAADLVHLPSSIAKLKNALESRRIAFATPHPALFERNHDIDEIVTCRDANADGWLQLGLPLVRLGQLKYDPLRDADEPPAQHILIEMCRLAGIGGPVELRPYFFLTREEFAAGKISENQVVMQSSCLADAEPMRNREWFPQRFQEVCSELRADVQVIQLGSPDDPKLEGATDLRGKTTVRQSAAILANSFVFIGLAGFLMHLARAVDCSQRQYLWRPRKAHPDGLRGQ